MEPRAKSCVCLEERSVLAEHGANLPDSCGIIKTGKITENSLGLAADTKTGHIKVFRRPETSSIQIILCRPLVPSLERLDNLLNHHAGLRRVKCSLCRLETCLLAHKPGFCLVGPGPRIKHPIVVHLWVVIRHNVQQFTVVVNPLPVYGGPTRTRSLGLGASQSPAGSRIRGGSHKTLQLCLRIPKTFNPGIDRVDEITDLRVGDGIYIAVQRLDFVTKFKQVDSRGKRLTRNFRKLAPGGAGFDFQGLANIRQHLVEGLGVLAPRLNQRLQFLHVLNRRTNLKPYGRSFTLCLNCGTTQLSGGFFCGRNPILHNLI